jgi:hypothetical protein
MWIGFKSGLYKKNFSDGTVCVSDCSDDGMEYDCLKRAGCNFVHQGEWSHLLTATDCGYDHKSFLSDASSVINGGRAILLALDHERLVSFCEMGMFDFFLGSCIMSVDRCSYSASGKGKRSFRYVLSYDSVGNGHGVFMRSGFSHPYDDVCEDSAASGFIVKSNVNVLCYVWSNAGVRDLMFGKYSKRADDNTRLRFIMSLYRVMVFEKNEKPSSGGSSCFCDVCFNVTSTFRYPDLKVTTEVGRASVIVGLKAIVEDLGDNFSRLIRCIIFDRHAWTYDRFIAKMLEKFNARYAMRYRIQVRNGICSMTTVCLGNEDDESLNQLVEVDFEDSGVL